MDQLMSSADQLEVVGIHKLVGHLLSKQPASPPGGHSPVVNFLRVRPDKVTEGSLVGDLLVPLNQPDLVQ